MLSPISSIYIPNLFCPGCPEKRRARASAGSTVGAELCSGTSDGTVQAKNGAWQQQTWVIQQEKHGIDSTWFNNKLANMGDSATISQEIWD